MKRLSLSIAAICVSLFMTAQTPQAVKYQSVVRDNNGALIVQGPANFRISVLEGGSSGTPVYVETHDSFTNEFGLVTFDIGGGTVVSGDFTSINWGGNIFFFKVELDATGGTNYEEMGTSQALSVPYALHAETSSDNHWVEDGGNLYPTNTGGVGIGTATPVGPFETRVLDGSFVVVPWNGGPAGTVVVTNVVGRNGYQAQERFSSEDDGAYFDVGRDSTGAFVVEADDVPVITATEDGRVGIGTTSPFNKLEVNGNSDGHVALFRNSSNAGSSSVTFSDDAGQEQLYVGYANTGYSSNYNGMSYINSSPGIVLSTQNAERMRITSTGEVGIGTTNPEALLHVAGTVKIADGSQGQGKVLTSDDNGAASWARPSALAYALIDLSGTANPNAYGIAGVNHPSPGNYEVLLSNPAVDGAMATVACTIWDTNNFGFISYYQATDTGNTVYIRIRNAAGEDMDATFSITVFANN